LSSQLEGKGEKVGAYYTPEYLADYLVSEMSSVIPLREGMKVLDPACCSGVFLVLIYARLIEMRLAQSEPSTLPLPELLELLEHIYGIEREPDACYVSEFSLILMLLHYADVSEFLYDELFKLPSLHNTHIFQYDFFDDSSPIWTQGMVFDWIIGNPPWIKANHTEEPFAAAWIDTHRKQQPVDNNNVAEAFSWRVLDLLVPTGYIGLILPAALLYNLDARKYRQSFFEQGEVRRMTNFSNLDGFLDSGKMHHRVTMERSPDLICCMVEFVRSDHAFTPVVKEVPTADGQMFSQLQRVLKNEFSQWVYVQRGLKMFEPSSVSLYKVPQLINWTRTQAMNDADDVIAEILSTARQHR
jgi:hypothetical protein